MNPNATRGAEPDDLLPGMLADQFPPVSSERLGRDTAVLAAAQKVAAAHEKVDRLVPDDPGDDSTHVRAVAVAHRHAEQTA
jgi:hypothetical protein